MRRLEPRLHVHGRSACQPPLGNLGSPGEPISTPWTRERQTASLPNPPDERPAGLASRRVAPLARPLATITGRAHGGSGAEPRRAAGRVFGTIGRYGLLGKWRRDPEPDRPKSRQPALRCCRNQGVGRTPIGLNTGKRPYTLAQSPRPAISGPSPIENVSRPRTRTVPLTPPSGPMPSADRPRGPPQGHGAGRCHRARYTLSRRAACWAGVGRLETG